MNVLTQPERSARGAVKWLLALADKVEGSANTRSLAAPLRAAAERIRAEHTAALDALWGRVRKLETAKSAWAEVEVELKQLGLAQWAEVAKSVFEASSGEKERIEAGEAGGIQGFGRAVKETAEDVGAEGNRLTRYAPAAIGIGIVGLFVLAGVRLLNAIDTASKAVTGK